jgi:glycosyltransferase involved in cell wall biosynthesis
VIATRVPGLAEVVRHGQTGLLLDPEDPVALAESIDQLRSDRQLSADLGQAGLKRAAQTYHIDRNIHLHEEMYSEVLGL